ncbi:MAG: FtsX-like permease family protein [Xanthomonadales bacterium]|jgi:putative ABC transport system permease protein|nr:FtsX-like permease family protein [Xanthomonadales bacterium]
MELRPILSAMRHRKTGVILIALQVALTLAILSNALYVVRDRLDEAHRISGVDEAVVFHVSVLDKERDTTGAVTDADLDALRGMPGVVDAVWVNQVPLSNSGNNSGFSVPSASGKPGDKLETNAATYMGDTNISSTWGLRLVEGRDFRPGEGLLIDEELPDAAKPKVALVTLALAKRLFPNDASWVGKPFWWGDTGPIEIIGVVDTLVSPWGRASWGGDGTRSVIFPARTVQNWRTYAVRVDAPGALAQIARDADELLAKRVAGRLSGGVRTMSETRERRYRGEHTLVNGLVIVMGLLLVMTASGIVGLASLWVNQRRKQIGVRRALGATRADILRLFLTENLLITGFGVLVGCGLALAVNQVMMRELELTRLPLEYLGLGAMVLLMLGVLAVLAPALRAAAVPPAVATRSV